MAESPLIIKRRIDYALARLQSLRDGNLAVIDLVACGQAAVIPLADFLFTREPSGIFLPRCLAVQALAALDARDVLIDFLAQPREFTDPVEQAGEDAVVNAVARALTRWRDDQVFALLLKSAGRKLLDGVVEALGEYRRDEALPNFADALGDDFCRPAAENAFRKMGGRACLFLLQLADWRVPTPESETESSCRRRRSAVRLFAELYASEGLPESIRSLAVDNDPEVAVVACSVCLPVVSQVEQQKIAGILIDLLDQSDWLLRSEIEELLISNYESCHSLIEKRLTRVSEPAAASLRRVMIKGCEVSGWPIPGFAGDGFQNA